MLAVRAWQVGIPVTVLERAPHLREAGACIMMQSNAWRALTALGVADELRATHSMQVERCVAIALATQQRCCLPDAAGMEAALSH
jgi:2-polyprenyl-6-methoxyphenol hydroxylase-like FAD-dependent oxidoreductase